MRLLLPCLRGPLGGLLGLGRPLQVRLEADAPEHEGHAHPLLLVEAVAVVHDGQYHGEHLAGDGDGDEGDGPEVGDRVDCCVRKEMCVSAKRRQVGGCLCGGNSYR